ncbi:hypothetical protein HDV64DRAFT_261009 [Trichoderma sp. TUCIM 5745]
MCAPRCLYFVTTQVFFSSSVWQVSIARSHFKMSLAQTRGEHLLRSGLGGFQSLLRHVQLIFVPWRTACAR